MAGPYYVRSTDGSDASDGLTWANAKATLVGALAVAAAGERVWVSQVHAETQASAMTLTSLGTSAAPVEVLCGNDAAEPPTALAITATISVTGSFAMGWAGFTYYYGIIFNVGSGSSSASASFTTIPTVPFWHKYESCSLRVLSTGAGGVSFGTASTSVDDNLVEFVNTTFQFSAVGQSLAPRMKFKWSGGSVIGSVFPTSLFVPPGGNGTTNEIMGVDLSALVSGKSWVNVAGLSQASFLFVDCKAGASVSFTAGAVAGQGGVEVTVINCDNGDTNYRYHRQPYQGTITQETTIIRTGGASDGTTPVSRKVVTTAYTKFYSPLCSAWMESFVDATGAMTVTISIVSYGAALLTNAQVWLESEYLGTSSFPLGLFINDGLADIVAASASQTANSVAWVAADRANSTAYSLNDIMEVQGRTWIATTAGTTAGSEPAGYASAVDGGSVTDGTAVFRAGWRQELATTFTTAEKGLFRSRVCIAVASTTLYFDPLNPLSIS